MSSVSKQESAEMSSSQDDEAFNYDVVLSQHLGQVGKFQLLTCLLLCVPAFFFGIVIMSFTFTGGIPRYRCFVDGCDNPNATEFEPSWLNLTVPWEIEDKFVRQCQRYNQSWTDPGQCNDGQQKDPSSDLGLINCDRWVYDRSLFQSTIVTSFDLTCDDEWKQTLTSTLFMIGMLVGAVTLGNVTDIFGRKRTFTVIALLLASSVTGSAFAPNFPTFITLRFFCGVFNVGLFLSLFVWGIEAVGSEYQVACGFLYNMMTSFGNAVFGLIAFYVRDWRSLQLIIGVPIFSFVSFYWIIPESTRWLISKKRFPEARKQILTAAKMNGKCVPVHLFDDNRRHNSITAHTEVGKNETIIDIFRSPVLCLRIFTMFAAWLAGMMGYYGITYSATNLSGNFHLNYVLSMVVEPPSHIFGIFSMNRLGRRPTLSGSLIISGLACLVTGLVPEDPAIIRIVFSLIGKFFISCVLATLFSYTAELFPTSTRSAAVGLCSAVGKIGAILSPSIADVGRNVDQSLPYIVFASVNIIVGFSSLLLPETNKLSLPTTIQDAVNI